MWDMIQYRLPVECAIHAFGSVAEVAAVCGIKQSAVYQWRTKNMGSIPLSSRITTLYEEAQRRGLSLTLEALVVGEEVGG